MSNAPAWYANHVMIVENAGSIGTAHTMTRWLFVAVDRRRRCCVVSAEASKRFAVTPRLKL